MLTTEHLRLLLLGVCLIAGGVGCTTVDPGSNFSIPNVVYNSDYFYCVIEPQIIFQYNCGAGDPSKGDGTNACHYNASAVSGMALIAHTPVDCGGGSHPVDPTQTGSGTAPAANYQSVSLEMSPDYQTAPFYLRPTGLNHPRAIFSTTDPAVSLIATWASMP